MGAISRVKVHYCDLDEFLTEASGLPIYGTYLEGSNIYDANLKDSGLLIMGNEGRGISPKLEKYVTHKLHIPSFPPDCTTSESLNVGVATAIAVSEFRRRKK